MTDYKKLRKRSGDEEYIHRHLVERKVGHPLRKKVHVHHIDGNKNNNKLANLKPIDISKHLSYHYKRGDYHRLTKTEMRKGARTTNRKLYNK